MSTLYVSNIKCGGCRKSIINGLGKEGLKNIQVDIENQTVTFEGAVETAKEKLSQMGYPEAGSKEAKSLSKKAKSFISCAVGRMK